MISFIILHYMVESETIKCIESIDQLDGEKSIVVVDNASPNASGYLLQKKYKNREDITIIVNKTNLGFARGNNIGCQIAYNKYSPDFYVVMNNDVEITQTDFCKSIMEIYKQEFFDVLGPDIYSTSAHIHQNPKSLTRISMNYAKKLRLKYEKKCKSKFAVPIRCALKRMKIIRKLYKMKSGLNIDYKKKHYNIPLHGSCLIFSRNFVENRKNVFYEGTFFYFESEILDYECQMNRYKVVYDPQIHVLHHQNISTNNVYKSEIKKVHFMNEQNYKSITAFIHDFDRVKNN